MFLPIELTRCEGIRGLLPPAVRTLRDQVERTVEQIRTLPDAMVKSLFLQELHNRNETLYHRILIDYVGINTIGTKIFAVYQHPRCQVFL